MNFYDIKDELTWSFQEANLFLSNRRANELAQEILNKNLSPNAMNLEIRTQVLSAEVSGEFTTMNRTNYLNTIGNNN